MNYFGKFDATVPDALGQHPSAHLFSESVHATHVPADAVVVSDAQLLFNAEFKRSGVDLVLSGDGREVVLHDYFKGPTRASIASPDGAHLTGDIVTALAGEVQLAQADGSAGAHAVIGHVTKLVGSATAVRNGVSIILNNGDNVEKGDVVASGSDSTVGITFIDGTVFGLSSNARMVLNEMVYDPNGSSNSSLLSLVAGTITFVAGETAKHGDMKVDTPVATMGIRGTAVLVEIDFTVPGQTPDAKFQVLVEPDGTTGSYILFDKQTLTPLALVDTAGHQININNGLLSETLTPLSPEIQKLIQDVFTLKFSDNSNTKSFDHFTDVVIQLPLQPSQFPIGSTVAPFIPVTLNFNGNAANGSSATPPLIIPHLPGQLSIHANSGVLVERANATGPSQDTISGTITFKDGNVTDKPTLSVTFSSFTYQDAKGNNLTLSAQQLQTLEAALSLSANPGNGNNGWTYSIPASALSSLAVGSTLTINYNATVNNNFGPDDETATAPFSITIKIAGEIWSETNEVASPAPGDWATGANWETGVAPTSADDVIIVTDPQKTGTPFYAVTINSAAFADSVTMNNLTGISPDEDENKPELDNNSSLTIGSGGLHLNADSILRNFGTLSVGGIAEILQHSLLQNSGLLTLQQGGDFKDSSSITNSGTIELAGGTLNVEVDVANADGTLKVDHSATLKLASGATITQGAITLDASSVLDVESVGGATLDGVTVTGTGGESPSVVEIGVNTEGGSTLTMLDGASIANGFMTIGTDSILDVESAAGATLDGVAATSFGTIEIGVGTEEGGSILTLKDGASVVGGNMTIAAESKLDVESAAGATLDGVTVTGTSGDAPSTIEIGVKGEGGSTLIVADGTSITNGNMTIAASSTLDVESTEGATLDGVTVTGTNGADEGEPSSIEIGVNTISGSILILLDGTSITYGDMTIAAKSTLDIESAGGATLNDVTVTNEGTIQVDGGEGPTVTLVLDGGTTITGGNLLIHELSSPNEGVVEIETGGATFDDVTVTNNNELIIDAHVTLTLTDNTSILGGTIDDAGILLVSSASEIHNATVNGGGDVTVADGVTLTLSGVTLDDVTLSGRFENADTLTLDNVTLDGATLSGGTDAATAVTVSADSEIDNATVTGDITVDPDVTLTLNTDTLAGVTLSGGTDAATAVTVSANSTIENATVTGDITVNSGKTLTLNTDTLAGVTLSGGTDAATAVTVSANSTIENATVTGDITVNNGKTLTLNTDTLDNLTLAGSFIDVGTETIDDTVTLNSATLSGGTLDISGVLDSTGSSFIVSATIVNSNQIDVVSGTLTIDPAPFTNTGTIEVDSKASLVLTGETVTNSVTVGPTTTNGTVQVDGQGLLTLNGSTINGGIVDNLGTIDVIAASSINNTFSFVNTGIVNADGVALTLSGTTISNSSGTLESTGAGLLKLVNSTINDGVLAGKIATATGNSSSTLNGITLAVSSLVTATVGVLELTGLITNNGEFDAGTGATLDLDNAIVKGGTLGGSGTIVTAASSFDTLNGVTIAHGSTVRVADGTTLDLVGTITDAGTIALGSSGHTTQLEISGNVSLGGGGNVTMTNNADNFIGSDGSAATLTNSDTISGAGTIGDSHLTLINNGTIDATGTHPLIIDTSVTNNHGGILEASAGATLDIDGNVVNNGLIEAAASSHVNITGNVTNTTGSTGAIDIFAHATVEITGTVSSGETVTFEQANGAGLLILDDSHDFKGTIAGLTEADPESAENHVDLKDLAWGGSSHMSVSYSSSNHQVTITNNTSGSHDSVTLNVSGVSSGEFEITSDGHGGTLLDDPSATGTVTIDSDQLLGISAASSATINFTNTSGNTGELLLNDSKDFTGTIVGFAGDGTIANSDLIDLADVNFANVATDKTTYTEKADGTGTLTLYDASGQALDSLNFSGNYQLANFNIENDGSGGTLIVDPPVNTSSPTPSNTVVASGPNQVLSGSAPADNFVFNFAAVGHSAIANFNPAADTIQFSSSVFANVQSILNAVQDDGHGNSIIAIDAHDSITLNGVNKAQLHANDFHVV